MFGRFDGFALLLILPVMLLIQFAFIAAAAYVGCTLALRRLNR